MARALCAPLVTNTAAQDRRLDEQIDGIRICRAGLLPTLSGSLVEMLVFSRSACGAVGRINALEIALSLWWRFPHYFLLVCILRLNLMQRAGCRRYGSFSVSTLAEFDEADEPAGGASGTFHQGLVRTTSASCTNGCASRPAIPSWSKCRQ